MSPIVLDGKSLAEQIEESLKPDIESFLNGSINTTKTMTPPTLVTILVGDNPASKKYIRMKTKACERIGMGIVNVNFPEDCRAEEIFTRIKKLNTMERIHGIMLQHPVPSRLLNLERSFFDTISPDKDVDGVTTINFGKLALGIFSSFQPATPKGILTLLNHYKIPMLGRDIVVVGIGPILGKPLSLMLANKGATVTMCHKNTHHLEGHIRGANMIISAAGVPNLIKADWVKPGSVLIDAGCNPENIGDIEKEAWEKSSAYTPIPGGVGPMTIATLISQTVQAAKASRWKR